MLVGFRFLFVCLLRFLSFAFYVSIGRYVLLLLAFVVLGLVSSVLSQEIDCGASLWGSDLRVLRNVGSSHSGSGAEPWPRGIFRI